MSSVFCVSLSLQFVLLCVPHAPSVLLVLTVQCVVKCSGCLKFWVCSVSSTCPACFVCQECYVCPRAGSVLSVSSVFREHRCCACPKCSAYPQCSCVLRVIHNIYMATITFTSSRIPLHATSHNIATHSCTLYMCHIITRPIHCYIDSAHIAINY